MCSIWKVVKYGVSTSSIKLRKQSQAWEIMPQTEEAASAYNLLFESLKFQGQPMMLTEILSQKELKFTVY